MNEAHDLSDTDANWAVYRLDDNGNRFTVETGLTRDRADQLVVELTSRGHKQLYWAECEGERK
jgi:hypothetical protein